MARHRLAPALALFAAAASAPAQDAAPTQGLIREMWHATTPDPGPRRTPVPRDAIYDLLLRGTVAAPAEGAPLAADWPDGPRWQLATAGENGRFQPPRRSTGWYHTTVTLEQPGLRLLEIRGHTLALWNGRPLTGDPYDLGTVRVPITVDAGPNDLWIRHGRRPVGARLLPVQAPCYFSERDRTVPDIVRGEDGDLLAAVVVCNASADWRTGLRIVATGGGQPARTTTLPPLPPLSMRKVAITLAVRTEFSEPVASYTLDLQDADASQLDSSTLDLAVRGPGDVRRRTFRSDIDGSVQYYAVRPARPGTLAEGQPAGLLLSLHGAGVEAANQAAAYAAKTGVHVLAPTNRRPFGFDWEDWGRLDALEVLADFGNRQPIDPARTWLTGHSMGGHGTWQLASHFPDRFAAVAPSAGWRDFRNYGGAATWPDADPVQALLDRSANASRTLLLRDNLRPRGIYVLHGDRDRSVPVREARAMRSELATFHADFAYYERPGAGHWWGNACLDWPPLIDFLTSRKRPDDASVRQLTFRTVSPGISSTLHWVRVDSQARSMAPSDVQASIDPDARRIGLTTDNVSRLTLDLSAWSAPEGPLAAGEPLQIDIDEQELADVPWPDSGAAVHLLHSDGTWRLAAKPPTTWKGPHRDGPFRAAFRNRMLLIYGTRGTPAENAWAMNRALLDAATFQYRGNGSLDVLADSAFRAVDHPDRNLILYGNADTNGAFAAVLENNPIRIEHGRVRTSGRTLEGDDLWMLAVRPRAGTAAASVGIIGGTGLTGMRATDALPLFVSGAAWPDWTIARAATWRTGDESVLGAGFFAPDWSLGDDLAWRD